MSTLDAVRRGRSRKPSPEEARGCQDLLARVSGLKLDFRILESHEAARAVEIVRGARSEHGGLIMSRLGRRELRDLDAILERAANLAAGALKEQRDEQAQLAKVEELAARARRVPFGRKAEKGLLEEIHSHIAEHGALHVEDVGLLVVMLASFATGKPLGPKTRFDRDPDGSPVLAFNAIYGPVTGDSMDGSGRAMERLQHLSKEGNGWFVLSRRGPSVQVRLGPRSQRILAEAAAA